MRFVANGPSISDDLLVARDEGRVVFFCGAGVSRARAALPDFFGLAQNVITALEGPGDSQTRKLVEVAREVESRLNTGGVISADRVFGLLERDFLVRDIQTAVAKALKPTEPADLSAHRILLDLATGPDAKVRLVTTNFDLLFEACDENLTSWSRPRLPDPMRYEEMDGIIHLHGRVNADYTGAHGDGFILSSAEFGRAYISQAWATKFISSILEKYFVVFVGYAADDPPVQYLLEALNRDAGSKDGLFAFQAGSRAEAQSRWLHKGVQPIPYEEADHHRALWDSLELWAHRASDPDAWYESVIAQSRRGPDALLPHERGQLAHVVSTVEGARRLATSEKPPPAEWLCVFDASTRFSKPGRAFSLTEEKKVVDPFDAFGLDSDPVPLRIEPDDHYAKREVPADAWHCFQLTRLDHQGLTAHHIPALSGHWATNVPRLPQRLAHLGVWIGKVSAQPAAVWWAAGQSSLHADIQSSIHVHRECAGTASSSDVRRAWRYLFEVWETPRNGSRRDWHELKAAIALDGWTDAAIRHFAAMHRPHLIAHRPFNSGPYPPPHENGIRLRDLAHLDVQYPNIDTKLQIPDDLLMAAVREWRKNLEHAVLLEKDLNKYTLDHVAPIEADTADGQRPQRPHGISATITFYLHLIRRLIDKDPAGAKRECSAWWLDDDTVFARLRIWACGNSRLSSGAEAGRQICQLNEHVFWKHDHQRDVLIVLARRWTDFSPADRAVIGARLLQGAHRWEQEDDTKYAERRAWTTLARIHWLRSHGCEFEFDVDAETVRLRQSAPEWKPEFAAHASQSIETKSGWVRTDPDYAALRSVRLDEILTRAQELSGHRTSDFVERNPYAGLAASRPIRALSALTRSLKRNIYPEWAWSTFLNADARKGDKPRLVALITERISMLPTSVIGQLAYPVTEWMAKTSEGHLFKCRTRFGTLWSAVIAALRTHADAGASSVIRQRDPEWAMEALNAPTGKLAQALMSDPEILELQAGHGFPQPWLRCAEDLLSLEGDPHRHALTIFAYSADWLFTIDPAWTEQHLLSKLDAVGEDASAAWAGFLWSARPPSRNLYLRLKPALLRLERQEWIVRHSHMEVLAAMILGGWGHRDPLAGDRLVADAEMRATLVSARDDFRGQVLWQATQWSREDNEDRTWAEQVPTFLTNVWPLQKAAKTSQTSARLCELACSSVEVLGEVAEVVALLATKIEHEHVMLHDLTESPERFVDSHPQKTLTLLFAVLSDDVTRWPYGIDVVIERIGNADPSLLKDGRLVELRRRWNAR